MRRKADIERDLVETAKKLRAAEDTIKTWEKRLGIWQTRLAHADIETAQARLSRDTCLEKLKMLLARMKEQGIVLTVAKSPETVSGKS